MTVLELYYRLAELIVQNKGRYPIAVQRVDEGVTFAEQLDAVEAGHKADGKIVWIYVGQKQPPIWARGFNVEAALTDIKEWKK